MKATDLRIGNIVDKGRIVAAITQTYFKDTTDLATLIEHGQFEKLTAERLKQFGGMDNGLGGFEFKHLPPSGSTPIREYRIGPNTHPENWGWCMWDISFGGRHVVNLQYTHEFQNAWAALTAQELEVRI
jgi:hypothetical protein